MAKRFKEVSFILNIKVLKVIQTLGLHSSQLYQFFELFVIYIQKQSAQIKGGKISENNFEAIWKDTKISLM